MEAEPFLISDAMRDAILDKVKSDALVVSYALENFDTLVQSSPSEIDTTIIEPELSRLFILASYHGRRFWVCVDIPRESAENEPDNCIDFQVSAIVVAIDSFLREAKGKLN